MAVKLWYVWSDAKERFVRAKRPPRDARVAAALQRLKIRLASTQDRRELFEFQRVAYETEPEIWLHCRRAEWEDHRLATSRGLLSLRQRVSVGEVMGWRRGL